MMKRTIFSTLGLALLIGSVAPGCVVRARGTMTAGGTGVVYQEPPAPRMDMPSSQRPGFIWVSGRWTWSGNQWAWMDGHWERCLLYTSPSPRD